MYAHAMRGNYGAAAAGSEGPPAACGEPGGFRGSLALAPQPPGWLAGARTSTTVGHASLASRPPGVGWWNQRAEPVEYSANGTFQSPMPLVRVIGLSVPVYSTTSPIMLFSKSQPAFAVLMPVQPWLTLARPWEPTDHGAAWTNSPEYVRRMANSTPLRL